MLGTKTFTNSSLLLVLLGGISFSATPDYFPLQVGNSWVYKVTQGRVQDTQVVEVTESRSLDGRIYYNVRFFGRTAWLRMREDGTLVAYDPEARTEKPWVSFDAAEGQSFPTDLDNCNKSAKVDSRTARYTGPLGEFTNALRVRFEPSCADAGITEQVYLPWIGLLAHETTTIAGPRRYELIYSRTGSTVASAGDIGFGIAVDAPPGASNIVVRLTLRNGGTEPLTVNFPSGQTFDFRVKNEKGNTVYVWSADKLFTAVYRTERIGPGERNYAVVLPLTELPGGKYTVEGFLTTDPPGRFAGSAPFELSGTVARPTG